MRSVCEFKVGAGSHRIIFSKNMFPTEGFNGEVHIDPLIRIFILEQGHRIAIVSCEMVNVPADVIIAIKKIVCEKTGTPIRNVWVHATHTITTPHAPDHETKRSLFVAAITEAATVAAEQAANSFEPAILGVGTGNCDVNANRDIKIGNDWYYGLGSTMTSNKKMTVMKFETLEGKAIGLLISYGIKPTAIDNVEMDTATRKLSSDVPGVACQMAERNFGVPVMFCMAAAGDQIPRETAMYWEADEQGEAVEVKQSVEKGVEIAERLGREMGAAVIEIADRTTCCYDVQNEIKTADTSFDWPNKNGDGEVTTRIRAIAIGDEIALIGVKPELNAITELQLKDRSPYKHTLLLGFVDGDSKYMPDSEAYDMRTWEWKRAGTAKGSAEKFVEVTVRLLGDIKAGKVEKYADNSSTNDNIVIQEKKRVTFGGVEWIVLEEEHGKALLISDKILEKRAYHSVGGSITWDNSEIREYLNGEFYKKTFTESEKKKILETPVENNSNSQYGVPAGKPTVDKLFLLSLGEAEKYFGGSVEVLRGIDIKTGEVSWWHLRSPGEADDVAACVNAFGLIDYHGVVGGVTVSSGGVRPAMWIRV